MFSAAAGGGFFAAAAAAGAAGGFVGGGAAAARLGGGASAGRRRRPGAPSLRQRAGRSSSRARPCGLEVPRGRPPRLLAIGELGCVGLDRLAGDGRALRRRRGRKGRVDVGARADVLDAGSTSGSAPGSGRPRLSPGQLAGLTPAVSPLPPLACGPRTWRGAARSRRPGAAAPRRASRRVRPAVEATRKAADEAGDRLAVARQRGDRDPLLRAVVAAAPTGPNSTAGTPTRRNETASEAPSRPTLISSPSWMAPRPLAQRAHERRLAGRPCAGGRREGRDDLGARRCPRPARGSTRGPARAGSGRRRR